MLNFGQDHDEEPTFASRLAGVVFADEVPPMRAARESIAVARIQADLAKVSAAPLQERIAFCEVADRVVVSGLSGRAMLEVARRIEALDPSLIDAMPNLTARRQHLVRAAALARIFDPAKLARIAEALASDDD